MNLKEAATKLNEQLFDIRYYKPEERVEIIEKALSEALKAGMEEERKTMTSFLELRSGLHFEKDKL